ncbi:MAG TPA: putative Na+/H+ antiporter [Vicinamibacterales bacterium]|nr:putative Na+/H+ antiporter [Vicinamibacterales bacterium]
MHDSPVSFPRPLSDYAVVQGQPLLDVLRSRIDADAINAIATLIFVLAVLHTFAAGWFTAAAHRQQARHDARLAGAGLSRRPSMTAELLHFLGEIEVVFALWALPLVLAIVATHGWATATHYVNDGVNYTEPMFVVVIMALASSRPVIALAESAIRAIAGLAQGTPAAWWFVILTVTPLLGSLITEPAAMTIAALLLARQFYDLKPSSALRYGTLGLLFVNVSIGGTLTHFAAPPVLMVARAWNWDTPFMLSHFGWRAAAAILVSTTAYFFAFRKELVSLRAARTAADVEVPAEEASPAEALLPIPAWVTAVHLGFMLWTVLTAHYPALFVGGFLFFIGFTRATAAYQSRLDIKTPLLVGFFLAGLVIHGGLQGWWIAPVLSSLSESGLFWTATFLTAFNDNALITYLATLVPDLSDAFKAAVVEGAVTGGGLTVIANAPNPAGQALLGRFFDDGAVNPLRLLAAAIIPTLIAAAMFRMI